MQIEIKRTSVRRLFDAILTLETREECYLFLMIYAQLTSCNHCLKRLQVAKMIKQGFTYATIEQESGASTATISRVKRSLQWGNDAYTMILDRMNIETAD